MCTPAFGGAFSLALQILALKSWASQCCSSASRYILFYLRRRNNALDSNEVPTRRHSHRGFVRRIQMLRHTFCNIVYERIIWVSLLECGLPRCVKKILLSRRNSGSYGVLRMILYEKSFDYNIFTRGLENSTKSISTSKKHRRKWKDLRRRHLASLLCPT